jgi:hypothetical protein
VHTAGDFLLSYRDGRLIHVYVIEIIDIQEWPAMALVAGPVRLASWRPW